MTDHTPFMISANTTICESIAANADLSGIGVRIAFYLQSFMNALLVVTSPKESVSIAWAGTLLTVSLVIAGIVGKFTDPSSLTLHHGTLIMNFVTLSCISSLATAPQLPIWRMSHGEYFRLQLAVIRHSTLPQMPDSTVVEDSVWANGEKKRVKKEQMRGKLFIACALLLQAVVQWVWGIIIFVSPKYDGKECNGRTKIVMFLFSFSTSDINSLDDPHVGPKFLVWPLWLMFCLGSTMGLVIMLSVTGPGSPRESSLGTSHNSSSIRSSNTPMLITVRDAARSWANILRNTRRPVLLINTLAFLMWAGLIISSERQRQVNNIDSSENDIRGFGQITALLLAMAPAWSLWTAFKENLGALRRRHRRERHTTAAGECHSSPIVARPAGYSVRMRASASAVFPSEAEEHELEPLTLTDRVTYSPLQFPSPLRMSEEGDGLMTALLSNVNSFESPVRYRNDAGMHL